MPVSAASAMNVTGDATDTTSYSTASWSPTTGKLYIVGFTHSDVAGNTTAASISGNSMTWTSIESVDPSTLHKLQAWAGYADGTQTTGAITFTNVVSSGNARGAAWGIAELTGTTSTGSPPGIVQSDQATSSGDSLSVTLAAFASAGNATGAWVTALDSFTTDPTITAGSGFSIVSGLDGSVVYDPPNASLHMSFEFRNDNDTGVDASAIAANDRMMMIAFEIAAAAAAATRPRDRQTAAIRRTAYW